MREIILNEISDLVSKFLYYDRKEDETLGINAIQNAIREGDITEDVIVEKFRLDLHKNLKL